HGGLVVLAALCGVLIVAALSERPAPPLGSGSPLSEAFGFAAAGRRRYLRTLIALLPVLGFVGTVLGIQRALVQLPEGFSASFGEAGPDPAFTASLSGIATAFETTLIGLVASFVFQFVLAGIERAESARLVDHLVDHASG
ncbi:MAG: MotA/TolQ/ExbB proton channel family protein, partial [Pseudomonadota bacterium]